MLDHTVVMEKKINWNVYVFESLAAKMDAMARQGPRGTKGIYTSAACMMFLMASPAQQRRLTDAIRFAEMRGFEGSIMEAAAEVLREFNLTRPPKSIAAESVAEGLADDLLEGIEGSDQASEPPPPELPERRKGRDGGRRKEGK